MSAPENPDPEALYEQSRQHGEFWCPPQDAEHAALLQRAAKLGLKAG